MDSPRDESSPNPPPRPRSASPGNATDADLARALLDIAQVIVLELDPQGHVRHVNRYFEERTGWSLSDVLGRDWFEACIPEAARGPLRPVFDRAIRGTATRGNVNAVVCKDGTERIVEWHDQVLRDGEGAIHGLLAIGHDVTDRVRAMEQLAQRAASAAAAARQSREILEGSFDASTVAIAYLDRDLRFLRVNKAYAGADGKGPESFIGKAHFELFPNAENEAIFKRVRDTGEAYAVLAKPFEYAHNPERGVTHWDWTLTPVKDARGAVTGLVLALRDVSERVNAIEALQEKEQVISKQLAEKEVLLREIHHRVKNNLQIVSSLLYIQGSQADDGNVARVLQEARGRVEAMALIHETVYGAKDLSGVHFERYLAKITAAIVSGYGSQPPVELVTEVSCGPLDIDVAVPCGLIVSELMTNAIKYAFEGRKSGKIEVSLHAVDHQRLCLRVRDNGIGIDPAIVKESSSLGLRLVRALAGQLEGELSYQCNDGTDASVTFRRREAASEHQA